jgi:hypothetical protein
MGLSQDDERLLAQLERRLARDDPELNTALTNLSKPKMRLRRKRLIKTAIVLAATITSVLGFWAGGPDGCTVGALAAMVVFVFFAFIWATHGGKDPLFP